MSGKSVRPVKRLIVSLVRYRPDESFRHSDLRLVSRRTKAKQKDQMRRDEMRSNLLCGEIVLIFLSSSSSSSAAPPPLMIARITRPSSYAFVHLSRFAPDYCYYRHYRRCFESTRTHYERNDGNGLAMQERCTIQTNKQRPDRTNEPTNTL